MTQEGWSQDEKPRTFPAGVLGAHGASLLSFMAMTFTAALLKL
jgi:hypothetical protein